MFIHLKSCVYSDLFRKKCKKEMCSFGNNEEKIVSSGIYVHSYKFKSEKSKFKLCVQNYLLLYFKNQVSTIMKMVTDVMPQYAWRRVELFFELCQSKNATCYTVEKLKFLPQHNAPWQLLIVHETFLIPAAKIYLQPSICIHVFIFSDATSYSSEVIMFSASRPHHPLCRILPRTRLRRQPATAPPPPRLSPLRFQ